MKKLLILFGVILTGFVLSGCESDKDVVCFSNEAEVDGECIVKYDNITNEELIIMLQSPEDYQFVDVRTATEYSAEKIPGFTHNVDYYLFDQNRSMLDFLDKDKPIVIMCNSGNRSASSSEIFYEEGFTDVYNLKFGIQGWTGETE